MTDDAFTLTTPRLLLRPVRAGDADALHRHWAEPGVRRFLWDDVVISLQQVEEIVAESERLFTVEAFGLWALRLRERPDFLGCGGYWHFHTPPQRELVISLSPAWWGRGFATEAAHALLAYAFDRLGVQEVQASTDAPNAPSRRLIDRLGFARSRHTEAQGRGTTFYTLKGHAYASSRPRSS